MSELHFKIRKRRRFWFFTQFQAYVIHFGIYGCHPVIQAGPTRWTREKARADLSAFKRSVQKELRELGIEAKPVLTVVGGGS